MELLAASTPSPASGIHTPPTPKHGFADSWEPYSPRKSARIAQRSQNRTPSPRSTTRRSDNRNLSFGSPRSKKNSSTTMSSPPTNTPQKKPIAAMDDSRRASGSLTVESTADAAAALGLANKTETRSTRSSMQRTAGMLPTPAKTPQKPPTEQSKAKIKSVARNLFSNDEDIMPSPRKTRAPKHILDSFSAEDADESIAIYTDSHERIPEIDTSAENPFYGPTVPAPQPARRPGKPEQVTIPGEGKVSVDEAVRREDGILTVFRGKKRFRKFADIEEASNNGGEDEIGRRPMTRSSIKPRLLFPVKPQEEARALDEDEEADTDIEDHTMVTAEAEAGLPHTPADLLEETPGTPVAPKFAPVSPPTTSRTTRQGIKSAQETTPMKAARGGKRSPFDGWRRVKNNGSEGPGHKRSGEPLASDPVKRTRA